MRTKGGDAVLRGNKISHRDALHDDFPSSFFITPKSCFIVLAFRVCIPLLLSKYKYPPLCTKKPQTGLPLKPSPYQSVSSHLVLHRAPLPHLTTPQPTIWHNAVVAFWAFMLAVVWGRLKTLCVCQPLSWVVARKPAGLRVERQECAYEWASVCTCWQGDGVPLWVWAHQYKHLVEIRVQHSIAFPGQSHWTGEASLQLWIFCCSALKNWCGVSCVNNHQMLQFSSTLLMCSHYFSNDIWVLRRIWLIWNEVWQESSCKVCLFFYISTGMFWRWTWFSNF